MTATSTIALSLRTMRAGRPAAAWPISRSTRSRKRERRLCGATSSRRNVRWRDRPVRLLNRSVTSAPSSGPAGQQAEVHVQPGGLGVVVAGPDVDVAAQAGPLAPDDERGLGVRLEADQPVDDVRAGPLELARPDDVRLLVEAGLDLDQDDDLLAALGRPDERLDDRRVARRPVQRLLDRQDVRVVGGLGDEPLDRRGERLVRVVDEDVAGADRGEDVGRLVLVGRR